MKPELEARLVQQFPLLYADRSADPLKCRLSREGIRCGDGWFDLIENLSEHIETHLRTLPDCDRPHARKIGRHEGEGGLVFRLGPDRVPETLNLACEEAQRESLFVCELCGKPGYSEVRRVDGVAQWSVRCDTCCPKFKRLRLT